MAELAPGARRRSVALFEPVTSLFRGALAVVVAAAVAGCATRDVYLVPTGSVDAAVVEKPDTSLPPPKPDAPAPEESGILHPPHRDAGDSGTQCEKNRYKEVPEPLGVYLMVDQSVPMKAPWASVVTALKDFINQSGSLTDVSMGIQYFAVAPSSDTELLETWQSAACSASTYATPEVPIDALPGNQTNLVASLGQHDPATVYPPVLPLGILESPTNLALTGAIQGLKDWSTTKQKAKLAVVLVTDGVPNFSLSPKCNAASLIGTQQVAQSGVSGTPSVVTFVLGVGDQLDPLNQIASSGGTDHAYLVASTAAPSDILSQLESIRNVALPCEIGVDASHLTQGDVNVELTTDTGTQTLTRVNAPSDCKSDQTALEWFAEQPDAGGSVVLCPATCASIRSPNATLEVVYGCPTVVAK